MTCVRGWQRVSFLLDADATVARIDPKPAFLPGPFQSASRLPPVPFEGCGRSALRADRAG